MTAPVLILIVRSGDRVSDAIAREAERLGVASTALLAASARELAELRRAARAKSAEAEAYWRRRDRGVREVPAERAARARGLVEAVGRAR